MTSPVPDAVPRGSIFRPQNLIRFGIGLAERIPHSLIALLGRFSIAAVFWKSGQTKVQGFAIDIVSGGSMSGCRGFPIRWSVPRRIPPATGPAGSPHRWRPLPSTCSRC